MDAAAGWVGGAASTLVVQPCDTVLTRMQASALATATTTTTTTHIAPTPPRRPRLLQGASLSLSKSHCLSVDLVDLVDVVG